MPETTNERYHCEPEATRIDESSKARASEVPEVSMPETTSERIQKVLRVTPGYFMTPKKASVWMCGV